MPELLTKYPEIALKILKDANIKCGVGEKQTILTSCPKEKFCALPTGELCIYGTKDISQMSQLTTSDLFYLPNAMISFFAFTVLVLIIGIIVGIQITKKSS